MNKTNNVIEKINVSPHNKVFSGECQKPDENLQGVIASLNFRLVSLFCLVCHCYWLAFFPYFTSVYAVAAEHPAEKNIFSLCLRECA